MLIFGVYERVYFGTVHFQTGFQTAIANIKCEEKNGEAASKSWWTVKTVRKIWCLPATKIASFQTATFRLVRKCKWQNGEDKRIFLCIYANFSFSNLKGENSQNFVANLKENCDWLNSHKLCSVALRNGNFVAFCFPLQVFRHNLLATFTAVWPAEDQDSEHRSLKGKSSSAPNRERMAPFADEFQLRNGITKIDSPKFPLN